ncbi:MAG: DUF4145 domain-containing protein [Chloroflexota bacterium]|nr:DUF4145 domain-containing protein [Chloroflexota bacterium]MDE2908400.1 DUF4145 domain-containing protein [Chloroflexota bacterium]
MPLPPAIDQKIRSRFDELIAEANDLVSTMRAHNKANPSRYGSNYGHASEFQAVLVKVLSLTETVFCGSERGREVANGIKVRSEQWEGPSTLEYVVGTLHGLKDDFENGFLDNLEEAIVANISADYMTQVEGLLDEALPGQYDHVPGAVLCGAVLEDALRRLCERQTPPVPTSNQNGDPKNLNSLIQDLQRANVLNKLKADQLRAWAKIRNSAAHGKFSEFHRNDVDLMVNGVKNFLADYL